MFSKNACNRSKSLFYVFWININGNSIFQAIYQMTEQLKPNSWPDDHLVQILIFLLQTF